MKKLPLLLVALATLFSPTLFAAKSFEGVVTMKITSGQGAPHTLTYSIKDGSIRTDMQVKPGMSAAVIFLPAKDEMIMLMPDQSMYMVMPIKHAIAQATGDEGSNVTLEKTGETKKILGYTCTKYLAKGPEGVTEIWATDELGTFMGLGAGMGGPMGGRAAKPAWESALMGKEFFPLLVEGKAKGRTFRLETTSVEPKSLPANQFAPPAGFRKFDMGAMMQGMGGSR